MQNLNYLNPKAGLKNLFFCKKTSLEKPPIRYFLKEKENHLEYVAKNEKVGGPKDIASLFSIEEIKTDFEHYEIIELIEKEIVLQEGSFHNGTGSVIRFVGRKK